MAGVAVVEDQFTDDAVGRWLRRDIGQPVVDGTEALLVVGHLSRVDTLAMEAVVTDLLHVACGPGDQLVVPECLAYLFSERLICHVLSPSPFRGTERPQECKCFYPEVDS